MPFFAPVSKCTDPPRDCCTLRHSPSTPRDCCTLPPQPTGSLWHTANAPGVPFCASLRQQEVSQLVRTGTCIPGAGSAVSTAAGAGAGSSWRPGWFPSPWSTTNQGNPADSSTCTVQPNATTAPAVVAPPQPGPSKDAVQDAVWTLAGAIHPDSGEIISRPFRIAAWCVWHTPAPPTRTHARTHARARTAAHTCAG